MKILLSKSAETVKDDLVVMSYFLCLEDRQVIIRRASEGDKGDFEYQGTRYKVRGNLYYGRFDHAIKGYALLAAGHSPAEGAAECLEEMRRLMEDAAKAVQKAGALL